MLGMCWKCLRRFNLQQNIRHAIFRHIEARYLCLVKTVRRLRHQIRQRSLGSGRGGSHTKVGRDVVNRPRVLAMGPRRRSGK